MFYSGGGARRGGEGNASGSALVQASLEHLQTAERSWDKWVMENGVEINKYPTDLQVLSYMSQMSRTRQRECLAQRGQRRAGGQKGSVRNYVAEMGNNLWPHKFPAFAKLEPLKQKQYWSTIFTAYAAMYAAASQAASTEEDEERAEQLVAQARACAYIGRAGSLGGQGALGLDQIVKS